MLMKMIAINRRIMFTEYEPTFLPAFSKAIEVMVQQNDVAKAAISPI